MKARELATKCGYEFVGNDVEINSIRYSSVADANSLAIAKNAEEVANSNASCVLVSPSIIDTNKSIIYAADSLEFASVKAAQLLMEEENEPSFKRMRYTKYEEYYLGESVHIGNNTIISPNVYIGNNAKIGKNCYIEPNVHIGWGTVIGDDVYIGSGSSVGANSFYHYYDNDELKEFPGIGITKIHNEVNIGNNTTVQRGTFSDTVIHHGCKIGNLIEVGHDVEIGINCKIVSQTGIGSNVVIGNYVQIFGQVGIANNVNIGDYGVVFAKSLVTKNVLPGKKVSGMYAREHIEELKMQAKLRSL